MVFIPVPISMGPHAPFSACFQRLISNEDLKYTQGHPLSFSVLTQKIDGFFLGISLWMGGE